MSEGFGSPAPASGGRGWGKAAKILPLLLAFLFSLSFSLPTYAQYSVPSPAVLPTNKIVLVLVSGLSWPAVVSDLALLSFARNGGAALLNCAVLSEPTDGSAYLSVGASERIAAPETLGAFRHSHGNPLTIAQTSAQIFSAQDPTAAALYRRYMGQSPPGDAAFIHLGIPVLQKAQPSETRAAQIGIFGETLQRSHRRVAVFGVGAAVMGMDTNGVVRAGYLDKTLTGVRLASALQRADVVIASVNQSELAPLVLPLSAVATSGQADVLLVCINPPRTPDGAKWHSLGFLLARGHSFAPGSLLVSPTTRTPGLVANVDIAPTIAALQNAAPIPGAAGRIFASAPATSALSYLSRLDKQVTVTSDATVPVMATYGTCAIVSGLCAAFAIATRRKRLANTARFGLLIAASALLALLLQSLTVAQNVPECALVFVALSVLVALSAWGIGRQFGASPVGLVFLVTVLAIVLDAPFGSPLVSRSILSGYYLAGIRFYGIGNEYMGVLIGCALVGPALLFSRKTPSIFAAVLYVLALFALANPRLGADAGGALAATVAFVLAFLRPRVPHLRARHIVFAFACAFLVVGCVAFADRLLPRDSQSHIGAAIGTGQTRGLSALAEIAIRKIAMNLRLSLSPYTLAAAAGLIPLWLFLARGTVGDRVKAALQTRPALAQVVPAALWGAFAAFAFNDSGVVAALLLLAPLTVAVIDSTVCDFSA